jgi:tetratricopeptide (TPR) repeat protein
VPSDAKHGLDGTMATSWLVASRQMGLPIAFIVDKSGKIAWIGSPVGTSMDEPLRKIADGSWDSAAFAEKFNSEQQRQLQANAIGDSIGKAIAAKNWDDAFKGSDELIPFDADTAAATRYFIMLEKKDYAGAYDYCKQLEQGPFARDAHGLYVLGWITVNPAAHFDKTNYDLGIEVLKKAVDLSYRKNPEMLDALAWGYFQKGDKDDAVEYEEIAINAATEDQQARLNQNLSTFKKK